MVDRPLVERKLATSRELAEDLAAIGAPLLAGYWEWSLDRERWVFYLVPKSRGEQGRLIETASRLMIKPSYRSVFSLSDVFIDARQIERARAISAYLRSSEDLGRQFDTTFTGGHYFESVIVVYIAPEFERAHHAA
jgi:hypothetical protein